MWITIEQIAVRQSQTIGEIIQKIRNACQAGHFSPHKNMYMGLWDWEWAYLNRPVALQIARIPYHVSLQTQRDADRGLPTVYD